MIGRQARAVRLGEDLPGRADLLVHETLSSEPRGEAVLPAIDHARARLLATVSMRADVEAFFFDPREPMRFRGNVGRCGCR